MRKEDDEENINDSDTQSELDSPRSDTTLDSPRWDHRQSINDFGDYSDSEDLSPRDSIEEKLKNPKRATVLRERLKTRDTTELKDLYQSLQDADPDQRSEDIKALQQHGILSKEIEINTLQNFKAFTVAVNASLQSEGKIAAKGSAFLGEQKEKKVGILEAAKATMFGHITNLKDYDNKTRAEYPTNPNIAQRAAYGIDIAMTRLHYFVERTLKIANPTARQFLLVPPLAILMPLKKIANAISTAVSKFFTPKSAEMKVDTTQRQEEKTTSSYSQTQHVLKENGHSSKPVEPQEEESVDKDLQKDFDQATNNYAKFKTMAQNAQLPGGESEQEQEKDNNGISGGP